MTDEWNKSREFDKINSILSENQMEIDFLTALKEARPFIERHQASYETRDYEGCIYVSELYGVPFDDRWSGDVTRRYIPAKFFERYPVEDDRIRLISLLENHLNWVGIDAPIKVGWIE